MQLTVALLVLLAVVHLLPEHLAAALGQSQAAWEYSAYGAEAAVLWLLVLAGAGTRERRAVALLGFAEAAARPACRLALPMDRPPKLERGQTLCDAVLGLPVSVHSCLLLAAVAALLWRR